MSIGRWLRHLWIGRWQLRRVLPDVALRRIEQAVKVCEGQHPGEIRVAIEASLPWSELGAGVSGRDRAIEVFSRLRVWDTEHNNGVLIYLLYADRDVEIVADRGVAQGRVPQQEWEACCELIRTSCAEGDHAGGIVRGIEAVAEVLRRYPPDRPDVGNELPDAPALL